MRVSISVTNYSWEGGPAKHLDAVARTADETGIDTVWVADHLIQADPMVDPTHTEHLEALTTLGFLAARTERVRLGTMVACAMFRPPAVLIKAISTLAVLTEGRVWFGVGAGHQAEEARAMGLPYPETARRFEYLEDTLLLARQMWAGDDSPFQGRQVRLESPVSSPNPAVRPRILVGGAGERRTLPLVARHADACNVFDIPDGDATVRRKLAVLASLCEAVGRPYEEIEKTISTRLLPGESGAAFAERCSRFADLGIDHAIVITRDPWTPETIRTTARATTIH